MTPSPLKLQYSSVLLAQVFLSAAVQSWCTRCRSCKLSLQACKAMT